MAKSENSKKLSDITVGDLKKYVVQYLVIGFVTALIIAVFASKLYDMMGSF